MNDSEDEEGPFEEDDLCSVIDREHPGGWAAYCSERKDQEQRERELEARSPWRRLEKRIGKLAYEAGIEPELARKLVEERLAVEIAEAVVDEFRREAGHLASRSLEIGLVTDGEVGNRRGPEPRVSTPYLDVDQAASYLKKTPKAIYGLIERGRLKKMPGSRVCYFTREMLDEFLKGETDNGRGVRPGRRTKG
ncbi:helix-turn-helix domain-containing protein [Tundrisphaera sp. TA3]|uniref:helix-turn-helix domain-containing protein n=1 Tax=Tundrisphaera sp. TA3 TaxID=3435775 RepID=UPI003EB985D5